MRHSSERRQPRHVVVLGAGLAGLFAAVAASGDGRTVTVLERDTLPDAPEPRNGVPQGRHPHVFLYRGLLAVEELLPGFRAELRAAGAVPFDTGDLAWLWEPDVAVHRQTGNRRHHYEEVTSWPAGLLVIGDALCAFNPVYGQGMTVAACEALLLRQALHRGLRDGDEHRLLRGFCRIAALPWQITTGEDARYPSSSGDATWAQRVFSRWARELGRLAAHGDHLAHTSVARVYHLMASPLLLLRPGLVAAVVRARLRGYGPATPRPAMVDADTPTP